MQANLFSLGNRIICIFNFSLGYTNLPHTQIHCLFVSQVHVEWLLATGQRLLNLKITFIGTNPI